MSFEVLIHRKAKKKYEKLADESLKQRLKDAFGLLSEPFSLDTVKLRGQNDTYRTRIGKYRIIFVIDGTTVYVADFDTRGKIYK